MSMLIAEHRQYVASKGQGLNRASTGPSLRGSIPPRPSGRGPVVCSAGHQLERLALATTAAALGALTVLAAPLPVMAVPQTSACATEPCDGQDYSKRDLRKEFYTKGSLKGANFSGSNLVNVSLFGANLEDANFTESDLSLANLGQANVQGANFTQAVLEGAIMSSARFDSSTIIDGADFTDVILRKDINDQLCKLAKGVNAKTNVSTAESLMCPGAN